MADGHYEIIIKNETDGESTNPIAGNGSKSKKNSSSNSKTTDTQKAIAKGLVAYNHYIKPFVNQLVSRTVTTVSLRTGATEQEERLSFAVGAIQKVGSFATSVAMGAAIGHLPGAIIGGLVSLATMSVEYANKQYELDLQRDVETIGLGYANMRAGGSVASFSRSRGRNQ